MSSSRKSAPKVVGHSNGHEWAEWVFSRRTMVCCNMCGIVRRADDTNKPCKGVVKVALRAS